LLPHVTQVRWPESRRCRAKPAAAGMTAEFHHLAQVLLGYPSRSIAIMFDNIFGIHEQALLLHGQRLSVLATNLANADTPNYKARDIDFAAVLGNTDGQAPLPVTVTDAAHIVMSDGGLPAGELKYRTRPRSTATPLKCR
jgi:hypothetical protein